MFLSSATAISWQNVWNFTSFSLASHTEIFLGSSQNPPPPHQPLSSSPCEHLRGIGGYIFSSYTKAAELKQPCPRGFSFGKFFSGGSVQFIGHPKRSLPNLISRCWLWRISRGIWANQKQSSILGVSWCCGSYCWFTFVLWCGYCSPIVQCLFDLLYKDM